MSKAKFKEKIVKDVRAKKIEVYFSKSTFEELQEVIQYQGIKEKLNFSKLSKIMTDLKYSCIFLEPKEKVEFQRDPKDAKFLELALSSRVDFLVSEDKDLLELNLSDLNISTPIKIINLKKFIELVKYS
jgi:putative PIN family toxin of toxin-antitoxin system